MSQEKSRQSMQAIASLIGADRFKKIARQIKRAAGKRGTNLPLAAVLEDLAPAFGYRNWNALEAAGHQNSQTVFPLPDRGGIVRQLAGERQNGCFLASFGSCGAPFLFNPQSGEVVALVVMPLGLTAEQRNDRFDELFAPKGCDFGETLAGLDFEALAGSDNQALYRVRGRVEGSAPFYELLDCLAMDERPCVRFRHDDGGSQAPRCAVDEGEELCLAAYIPGEFVELLGAELALQACAGINGYIGHDQERLFTINGEKYATTG